MLECVAMKMKSPKLYEHLRKDNILRLPSKSTLRPYMVSYRSSFGGSGRILRQLKTKTASIEPYKRNGGSAFKEIKLF